MKCSHNKRIIPKHISNGVAVFVVLNNAFLFLSCFMAMARLTKTLEYVVKESTISYCSPREQMINVLSRAYVSSG